VTASAEPAASPFGPRARWLAVAAVVSLCASALLGVFSDAFEVPSFGADAFSRSAIGHHAFVRLLRTLGRNVVVSRSRTAEKGAGAVVIVAEPLLGPAVAYGRSRAQLREILEEAQGVLLVLPKRTGIPDRLRPSWLGGALLDTPEAGRQVLEAADVTGQVVRPEASAEWRGSLPVPELPEPQLVVSTSLVPLLESGGRVLVGERTGEGARLLVLSDPDVLETHGLGKGRNAELVAALIERLDPGGRAAIVVDETLHGHELQPSLAQELLRWPLAIATLQAVLALALLAWAGLVRFGRPRRASPALSPGTAFLVENTADLLREGRHLAPALASTWRAAKEQIVRALRAPGEPPADLDAFVARLAAARGRAGELDALERRIVQLTARRPAAHDVLRAAHAIHAFREVMTHGARNDP
jgi:hypothetical protein